MDNNINFRLIIEKGLWRRFKACLRKVYWERGITIQEGLVELIRKFVEENEND